jgi:hypothetical protein
MEAMTDLQAADPITGHARELPDRTLEPWPPPVEPAPPPARPTVSNSARSRMARRIER